MEAGTILRWVRVAGVLACVVLGLNTVLEQTRTMPRGWVSDWLALGLHLAQAALFYYVTRFFPPRANYPVAALGLLFMVSVGIDYNVWIVNVMAISLVVPRGSRRHWLLAAVGGMVFNMGFLLAGQWTALPKGRSWLPRDVGVALGMSALEMLVWLMLAFLAGAMIERMEDDRRRLLALNAELTGSRAMLAENSRMAERLDIARELHDSLGHHLTTLNLELEIAQHSSPQERDQQVVKAQFLARLLLADLRDSVTSWRREVIGGLPQALRTLAAGIPNVEVAVEVDDPFPALPPPLAHALLRCAQEGITNALRHSGSQSVRVAVRLEDGAVVLSVQDDGVGCPEIIPGNGLNGIVTRAQELGGSATFQSSRAGGFRVQVRVPWTGGEP